MTDTRKGTKVINLHTLDLRAANVARARRWHGSFAEGQHAEHANRAEMTASDWTGADWANAAAGEMGEACNVVKKLRRSDGGVTGAEDPERADLLAMLADEIADTVTYLDLLAAYYGINLGEAIIRKFDRVSEREGLPERLGSMPGWGSLGAATASIMQNTEIRGRYPDGMSAVDVLTEMRAIKPNAFPLCSVLDVADELRSLYA